MLWLTLRHLKSNDSKVRMQAVEELAKSKDKRALDALLLAMKDSDYSVRTSAVKALGQLGDRRAIEALLSALFDWSSGIQREASHALWRLGWKPPDVATEIHVEIVHGYWETVAAFGSASVEPLIALLQNEPLFSTAKDIIRTLVAIGDKRAIQPLIPLLDAPGPELRALSASALSSLGWVPANSDEELKRAIAVQDWEGVVKLGPSNVDAIVAACWKWKENSSIRTGLCIALSRIGTKAAIQGLMLMLGDFYLGENAEGVLKWLKESGVLHGHQTEAWPWVLVAAKDFERARKLGSAAVEALIWALDIPDLWREAGLTLGYIGDARAVEPLIAKLSLSNDCGKVARALGELRDARAVMPLIAALSNATLDMEYDVRQALDLIGDPRSNVVLEERRKRVSDWDLQQHLVGGREVFTPPGFSRKTKYDPRTGEILE